MTPPVLSPTRALHDAALAEAREGLVAFAGAYGMLDRHLCGCGRRSCRNASAETVSLLVVLRAVATDWTGEPDPSEHAVLRARVLDFADAFGVLECPCGREDCPAAGAENEDARGVVRIVADLWHGRAGNRVPPSTADDERAAHAAELAEWIRDAADRWAWNLAVLDALALELDPAHADTFRAVAAAAEASAERPWTEEARAMAAEAAGTWLSPPGEQPEATRTLDAAVSVAWHGGWPLAEAALLERAAADACMAVLTSGLVHGSVTAALYAPFAEVVPLEQLHDAAARLLAASDR